MAKGDILRAILRMKHSPAGKKHIAKIKAKHKSLRGFSRTTHTQLEGLSDADYRDVMKAMGKK